MDGHLKSVVEKVIGLLVSGKYDEIVETTKGIRLDADSIDGAIRQYGRTLVMPPEEAYNYMDAIVVRGSTPQRWSVVMPLWTSEEGRSDLSVELTLQEKPGGFDVELDDIHVR